MKKTFKWTRWVIIILNTSAEKQLSNFRIIQKVSTKSLKFLLWSFQHWIVKAKTQNLALASPSNILQYKKYHNITITEQKFTFYCHFKTNYV